MNKKTKTFNRVKHLIKIAYLQKWIKEVQRISLVFIPLFLIKPKLWRSMQTILQIIIIFFKLWTENLSKLIYSLSCKDASAFHSRALVVLWLKRACPSCFKIAGPIFLSVWCEEQSLLDSGLKRTFVWTCSRITHWHLLILLLLFESATGCNYRHMSWNSFCTVPGTGDILRCSVVGNFMKEAESVFLQVICTLWKCCGIIYSMWPKLLPFI